MRRTAPKSQFVTPARGDVNHALLSARARVAVNLPLRGESEKCESGERSPVQPHGHRPSRLACQAYRVYRPVSRDVHGRQVVDAAGSWVNRHDSETVRSMTRPLRGRRFQVHDDSPRPPTEQSGPSYWRKRECLRRSISVADHQREARQIWRGNYPGQRRSGRGYRQIASLPQGSG